jgi:hypothetical protein
MSALSASTANLQIVNRHLIRPTPWRGTQRYPIQIPRKSSSSDLVTLGLGTRLSVKHFLEGHTKGPQLIPSVGKYSSSKVHYICTVFCRPN